MQKKDAKEFFTRYASHFLEGDLDAIAAMFFYPCIIDNAQGPATAMTTIDELKNHEKAAVEGFAANHISGFVADIDQFDTYGDSVALVRVAYELFAGENAVGKINWLYQLVETNDAPRVLTAKFLG